MNEKITEEEKPDIESQKLESNDMDNMIDSINENSQLSEKPDNSNNNKEINNDDTEDDSQILIKKTVSDDDEDSMFEMFNADKINADPEFPEGYDPLNDPDNENGDPL